MFEKIKSMFCKCESKSKYDARREAAIRNDRELREQLSEKQIDKGLKDTMEASDPVAKY